MEATKSLEVSKNKGDDFTILEDGEQPKAVLVTSQICVDTTVLSRLWTSMLTFHLFAVPAILGVMLGQMVRYADMPQQYHEDLRCCLVVSLMALSLFLGLPLHVLSMVELDDSLNIRHSDAHTQTEEL